MHPYGEAFAAVFFSSSPWGTIALAKRLESKYWHLPVQVPRLTDAPREEPAGGKRQGEVVEEESGKGDMCQVISSDTMELQPGCYGNQMDLLWGIFHISQPVHFVRH